MGEGVGGLYEIGIILMYGIGVLNNLGKHVLISGYLIGGLEQLLCGRLIPFQVVLFADIFNLLILIGQPHEHLLSILGLVDVVDVEFEEGDYGVDDVAVCLVFVVLLVTGH